MEEASQVDWIAWDLAIRSIRGTLIAEGIDPDFTYAPHDIVSSIVEVINGYKERLREAEERADTMQKALNERLKQDLIDQMKQVSMELKN